MNFGLLGENLLHTFSPHIYAKLGLDDYSIFNVSRDSLGDFIHSFLGRGLNVTIPHKKAVLPYCISLSDSAVAAGNVNLLLFDDNGKISGHNTDLGGLSYLMRRAGISVSGKKVLILGSGGAGSTAKTICEAEGALETVFITRSGDDNYVNLSIHANADIIINTTPVGMFPHSERLLIDLGLFDRLHGVVDLVYNPLRTRLIQEAERLGIPCSAGLPMLAEQARLAASLFLGREIPETATDELLSYLHSHLESIVLIGMPGCGKSTVAQELCTITGRELRDSDTLIQLRTGRTPEELIRSESLAVFRALESDVISEVSGESGRVIATGGGAPLLEANRNALRRNGRVYFIDRPISQLDTAHRPLSANLEALHAERFDIYKSAADYTIAADNLTPQQIAEAILEEFHEYTRS